MSKYGLEEKIMKCKKCKTKTIHIRDTKKWTIGRFFTTWFTVFITCGLYLIVLPFINKKGDWICSNCIKKGAK